MPEEVEVVYLEDLVSADYLGRPAQIANYFHVFVRLAQMALDRNQSTVLIKAAALGE